MEEDRITIGPVNNPDLYVGCHSKNDCTLYENIEGPSETWAGNKYILKTAQLGLLTQIGKIRS